MTSFIAGAWPWIITGISLAIFFAVVNQNAKRHMACRNEMNCGNRGNDESSRIDSNDDTRKHSRKSDNYGLLGMCLGMCLGMALGQLTNNPTSMMCSGWLLGYAVGLSVKRDKGRDTETKQIEDNGNDTEH